MKLISIDHLASAARDRGFRVSVFNNGSYAEIFTPEHEGPQAVFWGGSLYSTAQIALTDKAIGYGYNAAFHGPFHTGLCRSTDFGVEQLLAHPAMAGFSL